MLCMFIRLLLVLLPFTVLLGCKPDLPVSVELVPKDQSGIEWMRDLEAGPLDPSPVVNGSGAGSSSSDPTRMVVAIFQRDQAAWFFKITGPPEKVAQSESDWQPFIDAVKFESDGGDERPVWELPDGWSEGGKAQMVFAILKMPDGDSEIRISRLGGQQDLLSNVNRWRGQLEMSPATDDSLDDNLAVKQGKGGEYRLFDQEGKSAGRSMGGPFMRRQAMMRAQEAAAKSDAPKQVDKADSLGEGSAAKSSAKPSKETATNPKFTLQPPEGYSPGKTSAMVLARFVKETDDGKVQISVVPLTATNQWNDNVNFWRQSVGMEAAKEKEIESESETISVSGIEGKKIKLFPDADDAEQSLIGVMVKHDDAAWFFKMIGDSAAVKSEEAAFDAFLKSFEFTDGS